MTSTSTAAWASLRAAARSPNRGVRFDGAGSGDIGFSPDGRTVYGTRGDRLLAWDVIGDRRFVRSQLVQPQPDSAKIVFPRVSPDGQTVANFVTDGQESFGVQLLDVQTGTRRPQSAFRYTPAYFADMVWRPDSRMVASVQSDQWVDLWDRESGRLAGRHRVPERYGVLDSVGFSHDSSRLVVGTHLGWVHTVNLASMELAGEPILVKARIPVMLSAANRNGSRALVWVGGRVHLLDVSAGSVLRTVDVGFNVASMAWSPDGRTVVVAGNDLTGDGSATVALLDPATLTTRFRSTGSHTAGVGLIQFSLDGGRFVTAGEGRVGLWETRAGAFLGSVRAEGDTGVGFTKDSSDVLIASQEGAVSVWDPSRTAAVRAACRIAGRELTSQEWASYLPQQDYRRVCRS